MLEVNILILVSPHVDTCQNNFFEAVCHNIADVIVNLVSRTAGGSAAHVWNYAVGTEIVTSVVNLNQTAGVEGAVGWTVAEQVLVEAFRVDGFAFHSAVDYAEKSIFAFVVYSVINGARIEHLLLAMVDHAAHGRYDGSGVGAPDLVDSLTAFLVALIGDGTGVDYVNIRVFVAVHHLVTGLLELRRQGVCLIEVYSATQCLKGDFHFV